MKHQISLCSNNGFARYENSHVYLDCLGDLENTYFAMTISLTEWENDAYIFLPACVYDGNRFEKLQTKYPPMYEQENLGVKAKPVISELPAMNPKKGGKIQVTTGDLSVPCVGVYYKRKKQGILIFCTQECKGKNIGFFVKDGVIELQFPAMRKTEYRMCRTNEPSMDMGFLSHKGEIVTTDVVIKEFDCPSIESFFETFFDNRKTLVSNSPASNGYTSELWRILEEHMNKDNFSGEYYAEASKKWQCGWVGGGMSSLPLLQYGNEVSRERAIKTLDFMTSNMSKAGFFYTLIENGEIKDDGFDRPHMKNAMLTRKNGDALYFLFKHFDVTPPKKVWVDAASKCSDAFVRLYEAYGNFGQFVNVDSGEMMFGGTTSGACVISALVRAHRFFTIPEKSNENLT